MFLSVYVSAILALLYRGPVKLPTSVPGTFPRVRVDMHLRQLSVNPGERMMICASISTLLNPGLSNNQIFHPLSFRRRVEVQSERCLRTGSHTLLCRGVGHRLCGGYGGYTLPDYTTAWGPISMAPQAVGRAWATFPKKHARVPISRFEYPSLITIISWR